MLGFAFLLNVPNVGVRSAPPPRTRLPDQAFVALAHNSLLAAARSLPLTTLHLALP
jgi:hypothetical protein